MLWRYTIKCCCTESARFISSKLHVVAPQWGCVTQSNSVSLSQTHKHFTGGCWCPMGSLLFREVGRFLTLLTEKSFPPEDWALTKHFAANPTCQPIIWPPRHPTGNQWQRRKKNLWHQIYFPIRGKITFPIFRKAFSLPVSPQRWQNTETSQTECFQVEILPGR